MEDFEKQVEEDLFEAILANYEDTEDNDLNKYHLETIQHENAIKLKAKTFVGREDYIETAFRHCSQAIVFEIQILADKVKKNLQNLLSK